MNKIGSYLQAHLGGEVLDSLAVRDYFSTDASVLSITPTLVIYPRTTSDVRKLTRFSWQLAEKGHVFPITARGGGTDQTGAAIGKGAVVVFPAHLNKILELDSQQKLVRVQPGVNLKSLQETLNTHGLFLPPYPASHTYSTIGGAIANNASGDYSLKYGTMVDWVEKLEVVLANGELIQTGRISKKEVEKKKGLATLEGELYRVMDGVLEEKTELLDHYYDNLRINNDAVGYDLRDIRRRDGSLDLTPLFVGSQGTLGIVTEAIIKVAAHNPHTSLLVAAFDSMDHALDAVADIRPFDPRAIEMIDRNLVEFAQQEAGMVFPEPLVSADYQPAALLFVEFDDDKRAREKKVKKVDKLLGAFTDRVIVEHNLDAQEKLWAARHASSTVVNYNHGGKAALPVIEGAAVPFEKLRDLLKTVEELFGEHHIPLAIWGHAGDATLHVRPVLDLSKLPDRQKVLRLMSDYYKAVIALGGSIAAEHNDGRLKVPFVVLQVGEEIMQVFETIKHGFDKYGILNPGVKTGTTTKEIVDMLRKEYSTASFADFLPRS